ncbi:MAG: hypothetical protein ACU0DY_10155, partial [Citreimonas sp.]
MKKNIYVLGMLDWQLEELKTIRDADLCRFHSLLTTEELLDHTAGFDELLKRARHQLREGDKPDAIVCHWDFPSSCLAPILAEEFGLAAPSLEAVLRCEHKYWARIEQARVAPECVPDFEAVDPFDPEAADKMKAHAEAARERMKAKAGKLLQRTRSFAPPIRSNRNFVDETADPDP